MYKLSEDFLFPAIIIVWIRKQSQFGKWVKSLRHTADSICFLRGWSDVSWRILKNSESLFVTLWLECNDTTEAQTGDFDQPPDDICYLIYQNSHVSSFFPLFFSFLIIFNRQVQHLYGTCPQTSGCLLHELWRGTLCCVNKGTGVTSPFGLALSRMCRFTVYRIWQSCVVISRMARFSLLERDATVSSVTTPLLMNWYPDWSTVWADAPHRSPAAGENLEGVHVNSVNLWWHNHNIRITISNFRRLIEVVEAYLTL